MEDHRSLDDSSNAFSFRMFDLYRRFVEILQLNPGLLEDFQTGFPSEEVCRRIIKKTFQYRQSEDRVIHLIKYLTRYAKVIVDHVQNIPSDWYQAIEYTDRCIKEIDVYLKSEGIEVKTDQDSISSLARELGIKLHLKPNKNQIQAIEDYLKHDLKNPKRTIIASMQKKLNCKIKTNDVFPKAYRDKRKKKNAKPKTDKKLSTDQKIKTEVERSEKKPHLSRENIQEVIHVEQELAEDRSKIKRADTLLINNLGKSGGNSNFSEVKREIEDNSQRNDNSLEHTNNNKLEDISQNMSSIEQSLMSLFGEVDDLSYTNNQHSLKRKSLDSNENDSSEKKLLLSNPAEENEKCVALNCRGNENAETVFLIDDKSATMCDESSNTEASGTTNETDCGDETPVLCYEILTENSEMNINGVKTEPEESENVMPTEQDSTSQSWEDICRAQFEVKYSSVANMTYTEVLKLVETVKSFCESRNDISLEEFLVLRRIRDRIHWKSLYENQKS